MAGLVPAIHDLRHALRPKTWMPGFKAGHDVGCWIDQTFSFFRIFSAVVASAAWSAILPA